MSARSPCCLIWLCWEETIDSTVPLKQSFRKILRPHAGTQGCIPQITRYCVRGTLSHFTPSKSSNRSSRCVRSILIRTFHPRKLKPAQLYIDCNMPCNNTPKANGNARIQHTALAPMPTAYFHGKAVRLKNAPIISTPEGYLLCILSSSIMAQERQQLQ